ncbi:hypothetical protein OQA88_11353 [Cercophora sp. LCS_1]
MAPPKQPQAPFSKDERVLCFHMEMLYEAKILDVMPGENGEGWQYKIHYKGWKSSWDDWVPQDRVRKFTDENKDLAAQLLAQFKSLQTKGAKEKPVKKTGAVVGRAANGSDMSSARGSEERTAGATATQSGRGPRRQRDFDLETMPQATQSSPPGVLTRAKKRSPLSKTTLREINLQVKKTVEHLQPQVHQEAGDSNFIENFALFEAQAAEERRLKDDLLWPAPRGKYPYVDKAGRANFNDRYVQKPDMARVAYEKESKNVKTMTAGVPYQSEVKYRWDILRRHQKLASPPKIKIKVVGIWAKFATPPEDDPTLTEEERQRMLATRVLGAANMLRTTRRRECEKAFRVTKLYRHGRRPRSSVWPKTPTIEEQEFHPFLAAEVAEDENGTEHSSREEGNDETPTTSEIEHGTEDLSGDDDSDENSFEEENFHNRPSIKIPIADMIKGYLVDDWENVTKSQQLVPLPHAHPVNDILNDYLAFERPHRVEGTAAMDILEEVVTGIREYFDKALGRILLYRFERGQYYELNQLWQSLDGDYTGPCDTYGAEHLARLLVSLPELIAQTNMDHQSVNRLREELMKFNTWFTKHAEKYFVREYETPTQEYIDQARTI